MSLAGFKKQINKANQFMSEKIGGAKGTELDDEFIEMERKVDVMEKLVVDLMAKTQEMLQPNPATRAKMAAAKSFSKIRGQANSNMYPQPEGMLGDSMIKFGRDLGEESLFGQALAEAGDSYKQLSEAKYSLEDEIKQNFLDPLHLLQDKDLREVNHHRKKLSGRRLDYDCKKRKQQKATPAVEEEVRVAEEKFEESKRVTETAMHNLLENDEEQISQLSSFVRAEMDFHQKSVDILQALLDSLSRKTEEAASRPKKDHVVKRVTSFRSSGSDVSYSSQGVDGYDATFEFKPCNTTTTTTTKTNNGNLLDFDEPVYSTVNKTPKAASPKSQATAEAIYDFDPENEGELGFKEGDIIQLTNRIDENWLEGTVRGQSGFFPCTYVKILVDLQH